MYAISHPMISECCICVLLVSSMRIVEAEDCIFGTMATRYICALVQVHSKIKSWNGVIKVTFDLPYL